MKRYEFDYELYPEGICEEVPDLEPTVWNRGYYCETDQGVWYELYVNETVKSDYPTIEEDFNNIGWVTGESNGIAITTKTNPHSEITWAAVKAEMDKL